MPSVCGRSVLYAGGGCDVVTEDYARGDGSLNRLMPHLQELPHKKLYITTRPQSATGVNCRPLTYLAVAVTGPVCMCIYSAVIVRKNTGSIPKHRVYAYIGGYDFWVHRGR